MLVPAFMLGSFEQLLNYIIFTDAITLVVVASTLFVLRRRGVGGEGSFRVPLYPLLPALYLLCLAAAAAWILATQTRLAVAGLLLLATGAPLYALGRRING